MGYDTVSQTENGGESFLVVAKNEGRLILTRKRKYKKRGYLIIKSDHYVDQLKELKEVLSGRKSATGTRCLKCNDPTTQIDKERIKEKIPEYVFSNHDVFRVCMSCGMLYWQGTHYSNMLHTLRQVFPETYTNQA